MARSKKPMPPPHHTVKHKTKGTAKTAKNCKQTSLDALDNHTRAITKLMQEANREDRDHDIKMGDYAKNHAIKMKEYADKIFNMHMDHDALCQQHGECHEGYVY